MILPAGRRTRFAGTLAAGVSLLATPALADDLRGALIATYNTNPTLASARDQQRATDEGVPLAQADGLPSVTGTATETEYLHQSVNILNPVAPARQVSLGASMTVPLYSGGAVRNAVKAAETRVGAGKSDLAGTEASVFASAVAAYMDVILNEVVVRLNKAQVQTLGVNLQATNDRFQIGDLTRTDVAQSQSRLALAKGSLLSAEATLEGAREQYIQIIGKPAANLEAPPPLPGLPGDAEDAVAAALDHNPDLAAAHARSRAARFDTRAAGASRLPKLSFFADTGYSDYLGSLPPENIAPYGNVALPQTSSSADVGLRATLPIYSGGRPTAQVRQAEAKESSALDTEIGTERQVIAQVRAAFTSWQAAREIIAATQTGVDAAQLSLEGVKAENSVGNRTIIEVLNAEQDLVNAQVQLATAKRNAYVAGFSLLASMGRAGAKDLGLDGGPLYDPDTHYRHVRSDLWDWGSDPRPTASASRTVDTPAQDGSISQH
jgi:outer membrane protein